MKAGEPIGLLAGWGRFPIVVAEALRQAGHGVVCVGLRGHADRHLESLSDRFCWRSIPRLGSQIRFFHRHGVRRATMAGKLFKTIMFQRGAWLRLIPDWTTFRYFFPHFIAGRSDRADDTLLSAVTQVYADHGIEFAPATDFVPRLLIPPGPLTEQQPTSRQMDDIQFAWRLAKELGRLDVGQSVAVKGRAVLAVEAIEGTDQCIQRAGMLCPAGGFTVVKVAKPQQDMRYDVPTVGLGTIETMHAAGARVLAIEADRTILLDREELIKLANRYRIAVVALTSAQSAGDSVGGLVN